MCLDLALYSFPDTSEASEDHAARPTAFYAQKNHGQFRIAARGPQENTVRPLADHKHCLNSNGNTALLPSHIGWCSLKPVLIQQTERMTLHMMSFAD